MLLIFRGDGAGQSRPMRIIRNLVVLQSDILLLDVFVVKSVLGECRHGDVASWLGDKALMCREMERVVVARREGVKC